ncbi:hypothetical protein OTB20_13820 [Streptomyces sp. H27-H1]|uniref:hypothetical protein n=1 Tax=unclassified Streptomyces TaxID=2593676 RepID=UPI0022709A3C|nr:MULTISPECIES: hypothetical protein [unclassified Streptomyces]MCY0927267.1 hypothetical protein [Streptomyces sp. H27-H1]MCY0936040.1 hypothetical protein [Streptomyces sp. H34-S4]
MTEQSVTGRPLIPMPALTPAALRVAVAQIAPAHLPAFVAHLDRAAEQSSEQSTIAPLRAFLQWWGEFVAIQRHPARAARLRELEAIADTAGDRESLDKIVAEIQEILAAARREAAA